MNEKIGQTNWIKNWTATFQGPELVWNPKKIVRKCVFQFLENWKFWKIGRRQKIGQRRKMDTDHELGTVENWTTSEIAQSLTSPRHGASSTIAPGLLMAATPRLMQRKLRGCRSSWDGRSSESSWHLDCQDDDHGPRHLMRPLCVIAAAAQGRSSHQPRRP